MRGLVQDFRYALRGLVRAPGFAIAVIVTMALGIGMNSAVFSVVNGVLLQPLQARDPENLVAIRITLRGQSWWSASPADVADWRTRSQALESVIFAQPVMMGLAADAEPQQVKTAHVSTDFFETLGRLPQLGSSFAGLGSDAGTTPSIVLSHGLWQRAFGGDPELVGRSLILDGEPYEVVGIMGEDFNPAFLWGDDLYVARVFTAEELTNRGRLLRPIARVREGTTLGEVQADLERVSAQVEADNPETMSGWGARAVPLQEQVVGPIEPVLWTLFGAVAFVLLVGCVNVGNLLVARGTTRAREMSLRRAIGAGRGRITRQLLTEAILLSSLGGALGLLLAIWATEALVAAGPGDIPRLGEIGLDSAVVAFTMFVSVLAAIAFGLAPAISLSAAEIQDTLKGSTSRTGGTRREIRIRGLLVAAEVALVFVLMVGAGLMVQSLRALTSVDAGFISEGRLAVQLSLPATRLAAPSEVQSFYSQLLDELWNLPGVQTTGAITSLPMVSPAGFTTYHLVDDQPDPPPGAEPVGGGEFVYPGYFEAMGIELLSGRFLGRNDNETTVPVVVINDVAAQLYWPDDDPIGQRIRLAKRSDSTVPSGANRAYEVVGVVRGVHYSLDSEVRPRVYVSLLQQSFFPIRSMWVVLATDSSDPTTLLPAVRSTVKKLDPGQPLGTAASLQHLRHTSIARPRLQTMLLSAFGLIAMTLGIVGVYGVVNFAVARRAPELGLRIALGAPRDNVALLVLVDALVPIVAGIAAGIAGALALSRVVGAQLFGISGSDPATFVAIALLLLFAGLGATIVPGRRAMRLDPVHLLRNE